MSVTSSVPGPGQEAKLLALVEGIVGSLEGLGMKFKSDLKPLARTC